MNNVIDEVLKLAMKFSREKVISVPDLILCLSTFASRFHFSPFLKV